MADIAGRARTKFIPTWDWCCRFWPEVGDAHQNFVRNSAEKFVCAGKDVAERTERLVQLTDGQVANVAAFDKPGFLAYLDFELKVFLHEFDDLHPMAKEALVAVNIARY